MSVQQGGSAATAQKKNLKLCQISSFSTRTPLHRPSGLRSAPRNFWLRLTLWAVRWCSGQGRIGLVIERSPVRLPAVPLPGSIGQFNSAFHPPGQVNRVPACGVGLGRGAFTCVGQQITQCDLTSQVRPVALFFAKSVPCKLQIPFLANTIPCEFNFLISWINPFLANSYGCELWGLFPEYSFPCNFHPLSLQIQFLANSAPPNLGKTVS